MSAQTGNDFERAAREQRSSSLGDFWYFLRCNKKWWLLPIVVVLVLMAALAIFSGGAAAPFLYTLF
ncbi:MAG TPA: DUF5989 family protein [Gemmataceae bacterium]|nr:DUF5989 family protein [Gemmataceae bacterium]